MNLDYLISRANIHGASTLPPGGALAADGITMQEVHAALAFGLLPLPAYWLGRCVYLDDWHHRAAVEEFGAHLVRQLFQRERWQNARAHASEITGPLPERFAKLALQELLKNDICKKCSGTGYVEAKQCRRCHGAGRRGEPDRYNADFCGITYAAWQKTWKRRYQLARHIFRAMLLEFEIHLPRYAGR